MKQYTLTEFKKTGKIISVVHLSDSDYEILKSTLMYPFSLSDSPTNYSEDNIKLLNQHNCDEYIKYRTIPGYVIEFLKNLKQHMGYLFEIDEGLRILKSLFKDRVMLEEFKVEQTDTKIIYVYEMQDGPCYFDYIRNDESILGKWVGRTTDKYYCQKFENNISIGDVYHVNLIHDGTDSANRSGLFEVVEFC